MERLITAAATLVEAEKHAREANALLEEAIGHLAEASSAETKELEERASELERLAESEGRRAHASALSAGAGDPWPPLEGAGELLVAAQEGLRETEQLIEQASGLVEEKKLRLEQDRLEGMLNRVSSLVDERR